MAANSPSTYFIAPDVLGGVVSVVSNILHFSDDNNTFLVLYKNKRDKREPAKISPELERKVIRFAFDGFDNLNCIFLRFCKKLNTKQSVWVATDSFELQALATLGLRPKIIFMVLGDFNHYYESALKFDVIIDGYIAISEEIKSKLISKLPSRKKNIHLSYFPVPEPSNSVKENNQYAFNAVFVGRLEKGKNPLILLEVDAILLKQDLSIQWTIVGDGPLMSMLRELTKDRENFNLVGFLNQEELQQVYEENKLFIMPSISEGLPVSLVEAMKHGLIPIISSISGGIKEVVESNVNGFLCISEDSLSFSNAIKTLCENQDLSMKMSRNAIEVANQMFDPIRNAKKYLDIIENVEQNINVYPAYKSDSILDRKWMPNILVNLIRRIKYAQI